MISYQIHTKWNNYYNFVKMPYIIKDKLQQNIADDTLYICYNFVMTPYIYTTNDTLYI